MKKLYRLKQHLWTRKGLMIKTKDGCKRFQGSKPELIEPDGDWSEFICEHPEVPIKLKSDLRSRLRKRVKPKAEEPKAEEPKAEEPKAEEPKAEEPKAEEPKAEEPKAEEPAQEELIEEAPAKPRSKKRAPRRRKKEA